MSDCDLPTEITKGADLRGNEYGWPTSLFPNAIAKAKVHGFACLGGQFQFRLDVDIYEMYWLDVDSKDRSQGESWQVYCERSCSEVLEKFEKLLLKTDWEKEASGWPTLPNSLRRSPDPLGLLIFVAYFVDEVELKRLVERVASRS